MASRLCNHRAHGWGRWPASCCASRTPTCCSTAARAWHGRMARGARQPPCSSCQPCMKPWGRRQWVGCISCCNAACPPLLLLPFSSAAQTWPQVREPAQCSRQAVPRLSCAAGRLTCNRPTWQRYNKNKPLRPETASPATPAWRPGAARNGGPASPAATLHVEQGATGLQELAGLPLTLLPI